MGFGCKKNITLIQCILHHNVFGPGPAGTKQADIVNPYRIAPSHMFVIHTFATRWQAWTSLREQRVYLSRNCG